MDSAERGADMADAPFGAADMLEYFAELDEALVRAGATTRLHLFVAGGAVIATKSGARLTADVDVVSEGMTALLRRCVAEVATRHRGLRSDWLNDAARVKRVDVPMEPERFYDGRILTIDSAGDLYVLVMKLASGREIDRRDCEMLIRSLGISDLDELLDLIRQGVPESRQHPEMAHFASECLRNAHRSRSRSSRSSRNPRL